DQEKRTVRRGRRWLWLLVVAPALLLVLLAATATRTIIVPVGDHWFFIGGVVMPGFSRQLSFLDAGSYPLTGFVDIDDEGNNGVWMAADGWGCNLRIGDYTYAVGRLRGKKTYPTNEPAIGSQKRR
ncbi:MAG TPA: hypothetical protein VK689_06595, partial [Armatimonadota bacterium]|nr:hypothetical protein [Armatimonadota bacterium]